MYLPEEIHTSAEAFQVALRQLKEFPWKSHKYGTCIVLGLGLLIHDCWSVQELEEPGDWEQRTAPTYLYSSLLGMQKSEFVFVEVDVMSVRLDMELSSQTGEGNGGNNAVDMSRPEGQNEEVGEWNEEVEEWDTREEERTAQMEKQKEEEKRQREEANAEKRRQEDAPKVRDVVEEERLVQAKCKKCKVRNPSPVACASTPIEQDKLHSDDEWTGLEKCKKTSQTNKDSLSKNIRSSKHLRKRTKRARGSF